MLTSLRRLFRGLSTTALALIVLLSATFTLASHAIAGLAFLISSALDLVDLPSPLGEARRQSVQAEDQLADANRRVATLTGEREDLNRRVSTLQTELDASRSEARALSATVRTQNVELADRRATIANLNLDNIRLQNANHVMLDGRRVTLRDAVRHTSRSIQTRTRRVAASNLGAAVGEAIPFYGIGIIVAATTFELAMACETMTDLHALDVALDPAAAIPDDRQAVCAMQVPTREELWAAIKASPGAAWDASALALGGARDWAGDLEAPDFGAGWSAAAAWFGGFFE